MQNPVFCATCNTPLEFHVPELTNARWHANCTSCGNATALEAVLHEPGELASFNATGVYAAPKSL